MQPTLAAVPGVRTVRTCQLWGRLLLIKAIFGACTAVQDGISLLLYLSFIICLYTVEHSRPYCLHRHAHVEVRVRDREVGPQAQIDKLFMPPLPAEG